MTQLDAQTESNLASLDKHANLAQNSLPEHGGDFVLSAPIAMMVTVALLLVSTWGTRWLEIVTNDPRPFTLLFLVPVAFGSAFFGVSGGLLTAFTAVVIARFFLFSHSHHAFLLNSVSDDVEIGALIFGTITIALVTGRLREVLSKLRQANTDLRESEELRRNFSSEVLQAVTGGVLRLCSENEIHQMVGREPDLTAQLNEPFDASRLRHLLIDEIINRTSPEIRAADLGTAATEAASNAIKHGNGGKASAWFDSKEVHVLVEDNGGGISPAQLARATLERGFSTQVSLGMGYFMMIESVDCLCLSTSSKGTTILLTVGTTKKSTIEENIVSRYSGS